jgi:hypothetical protein
VGPCKPGAWIREELNLENSIEIEDQTSESIEDYGKFFTWPDTKLQDTEDMNSPSKKKLRLMEAKKKANK